jgi:hypothetical protein
VKIDKPQHQGTLTPNIEALVNDFITELSGTSREYTPQDYLDLLTCPVVKAPINVITLLGLSYFGEYTHKDEKIQDFVLANFEGMRGSIHTTFTQLMSAIYMGCSVAEWGIVPKGKQWVIDRIKILTPGRWTFRGSKGEIDEIRYYSTNNIDVPYAQCLHIINNQHLSFDDPRGVSDLDGAIAAVKAWRILMSEMVIAGQRKATPLTAGYYDPEVPDTPLYDAEGNPLLDINGEQRTQSPGAEMSEQLSNLENKTTVVTSAKNRIEAIANNADIDFFTEALRVCHKIIFLSFLFPETGLEVVGSGGSGDSNLNKGHMALLRLNIEQIVDQIKEEMVEKLIRPLILWNFGEQDDWGTFQPAPGQEEMRVEVGNLLVSALANQIFTVDDLAVINKLRELVGIPLLDKLPEPPPPQEGQEPAPTDEGFSLNDLGVNYWRMFETNGAAKTVA